MDIMIFFKGQATDFYTKYDWMIQIFAVVFLTVIVHRVISAIVTKISNKTKATKNFFDQSLVTSIQKPLEALIWLYGLCFAATIAGSQPNSPDIFEHIHYVQVAMTLFIVTWFFTRLFKQLETDYIEYHEAKGKEVDITLIHAIAQLMTIGVVVSSLLIGMQMFGVPISGLLAFGGIGGAGIAFASKDLLANFFGGIIIYLDRPFKVGDWIRSPDRNIEGTVEYIGWRLTRIRTFDKRPLYVPNGTFLTISVENPSRMSNRRIKTLIGVRYDDAAKIATITDSIKVMLNSHPEIDQKQTIIVNLIEFAASSLNIMVYTFTKTTNWVEFQIIQQDVFLKIIEIIESHGAECAFPTTTLQIPDPITVTH